MTIETLHQKFIHKLPGETAQERMSPQPKYVEGKEGIHQGHPISSAVMMLLVPTKETWRYLSSKEQMQGNIMGDKWPYPVVKVNRETGIA